uniref:Uncharacterized protein n=1 Tax=Picea glauca TaxID=3330 RepID=A0A101LWI0_PICGL|nr:hypothetical protein ABT39_MTgene1329 [Picea glauca]QHR89517.1 hypothetical protein Q903MT_gene3539 [Picea sitchensis]
MGKNTWVATLNSLFTFSTYLPYLCIYFLHPIFVFMECCMNFSCKALWDRHNCPFDSLQPDDLGWKVLLGLGGLAHSILPKEKVTLASRLYKKNFIYKEMDNLISNE